MDSSALAWEGQNIINEKNIANREENTIRLRVIFFMIHITSVNARSSFILSDYEKVRGPNGTTHEKRRAPLAATQSVDRLRECQKGECVFTEW